MAARCRRQGGNCFTAFTEVPPKLADEPPKAMCPRQDQGMGANVKGMFTGEKTDAATASREAPLSSMKQLTESVERSCPNSPPDACNSCHNERGNCCGKA